MALDNDIDDSLKFGPLPLKLRDECGVALSDASKSHVRALASKINRIGLRNGFVFKGTTDEEKEKEVCQAFFDALEPEDQTKLGKPPIVQRDQTQQDLEDLFLMLENSSEGSLFDDAAGARLDQVVVEAKARKAVGQRAQIETERAEDPELDLEAELLSKPGMQRAAEAAACYAADVGQDSHVVKQATKETDPIKKPLTFLGKISKWVQSHAKMPKIIKNIAVAASRLLKGKKKESVRSI